MRLSGENSMASVPEGMDPAQALWEMEQVKQVKARYFRFLDAKDWDAFAGLFTEDCVHHLPDGASKAAVSNADYLAGVRRQLSAAVTTHIGHMPEVKLLSPTEAEATWSMFDLLQWAPADGGPREVRGYGHYYETYRKCADGEWRISSKRNIRQRMDRMPTT
jgi:ketosteroid isomerase-like protein